MKSAIFFCLCLLSITLQVGYAQSHHPQSSTIPLAVFQSTAYVVIPATGFTATLVHTKRTGHKGDEFLDIINVFLPESYVRQKLVDSNDIGDLGLFIHDELLVTMAVLPNLASGQVEWVPISLDTLANNRKIAWQKVADDCYTRLFNYKAVGGPAIDWSRRRTDLHPIIKRGKQYFTPKKGVLTEYYVLRNNPTWYPTNGDNATINCLARIFSYLDYEKALAEITISTQSGKTVPQLRSELSTKLMLEKVEHDVYTFWSLAPNLSEWYVVATGAGSLRFKPTVGIISGKYGAHFSLSDADKYSAFFELIQIEQISKTLH